MNFKELAKKLEERKLVPGHRTCSGCGIPQIVRAVLASTDKHVVVANATGCCEVTTTIYPYSSWNVPFIHSAFENAASTIAGVEAAYKKLRRKGEIKKEVRFVAFGGDGGTYDIGLQALSGAIERRHDFLYVLYDNEAYENTGVQRSSATPYGAATTTSPAGSVHPGKEVFRKNIVEVIAAHDVPYCAQAALHNLCDLTEKAKKAFATRGPTFICVLQPCTLGWKYSPELTVEVSKLAVETRFWPLYEIENGKYKLNYRPKKNVPVTEFLKLQGRFRHLFKKGNEHILEKIQEHTDSEWQKLLARCGEK